MNPIGEPIFWIDQNIAYSKLLHAEEVEFTEIKEEYEEDKRIVGRI